MSRLDFVELYRLFIFSLGFINKEESLKMENLMKGTHRERQKYALLPKHTSTQRFHSPVTTLEDMTSWWGALVMLSKTENTFLKTTIVQCRN